MLTVAPQSITGERVVPTGRPGLTEWLVSARRPAMTMSFERTRAIVETRQLLRELMAAEDTRACPRTSAVKPEACCVTTRAMPS